MTVSLALKEIKAIVADRVDELVIALREFDELACLIAHLTLKLINAGGKVTEVDYVARYFQPAVDRLNQELVGAVKGTTLVAKAGAVFCHKRALFTLTQPATGGTGAEIGDLLIVITYEGSDATERSAQLLQFKFGEDRIGLSDSHTPQYALYNDWREFSWQNVSMGAGKRKVTGIAPNNCAKYALVSPEKYHRTHGPWWVETIAQVADVNGKRTLLAVEMGRHAMGESGRLFDPLQDNNDWDQVVAELIRSTRQAQAQLASQGFITKDGTGLPVHYGHVDFETMLGESPSAPAADEEIADDAGGISILQISFGSAEE